MKVKVTMDADEQFTLWKEWKPATQIGSKFIPLSYPEHCLHSEGYFEIVRRAGYKISDGVQHAVKFCDLLEIPTGSRIKAERPQTRDRTVRIYLPDESIPAFQFIKAGYNQDLFMHHTVPKMHPEYRTLLNTFETTYQLHEAIVACSDNRNSHARSSLDMKLEKRIEKPKWYAQDVKTPAYRFLNA